MRRTRGLLTVAAVLGCAALAGPASGQGYGGTDGAAKGAAPAVTPTTVSTRQSTSAQVDITRPERNGRVIIRIQWAFRALSRVQVSLHSDPISLGEFTADADGSLEAIVEIPPQATLGSHDIVATGESPSGAPVRIAIPIEVVASALPSDLAFTGSNAASMLALGAMLVVMGMAATVAARRRIATVGVARYTVSDRSSSWPT